MKLHDIQLNIYGTSLGIRSGSGMTSRTSWTLNVHCIRNVVVAQRLILSMIRMMLHGCLWGLAEVIPGTE